MLSAQQVLGRDAVPASWLMRASRTTRSNADESSPPQKGQARLSLVQVRCVGSSQRYAASLSQPAMGDPSELLQLNSDQLSRQQCRPGLATSMRQAAAARQLLRKRRDHRRQGWWSRWDLQADVETLLAAACQVFSRSRSMLQFQEIMRKPRLVMCEL